MRALLDKANVGTMRYRTFATQKAPQLAGNAPAPAPVPEAPAAQPVVVSSQARRALHSIFEGNTRLRIDQPRPRLAAGSGVAVAFGSCAGGVGKTTLCATIARTLSSRVANVLLADRCTDSIVPFYFSLDRQSAGGLQTVYPNARRAGYQMTLVVAPTSDQPHAPANAWLAQLRAESVLTLLDLPTFQGASAKNALEGASQILVPLVPDVHSIASIERVEEISHSVEDASLPLGRTLFALNRFDEAKPLHREIRTHLEKLLGDRLAPIAIRESDYVPEALSLGMTVLDHTPQAAVTKDFEQFAGWLEEHLMGAAAAALHTVGIA